MILAMNRRFVSASVWTISVNATIIGVGMLIGPRALQSLNGIGKIQLRMIVATFNSNPSTTIICYSPINASDETDLVAFCNELASLSIPKYNFLIIGVDMNAQFCKNVSNKFSLHTRQIEMGNT